MKKKSLLIAIIVFLFDILIKYIVDKTIFYGTLKSIIPKFFYITKVHNNAAPVADHHLLSVRLPEQAGAAELL